MIGLVVALGLVAGALTTVAGLGGGLLLVVVLAYLLDPASALNATALGLLAGNLHRVFMYRRNLRWDTAAPFLIGAVPGAWVAGLAMAWMPPWAVFGGMAVVSLLAVFRLLGWLRLDAPRWAGAPMGFAAGVTTATSGGGGLLVAPWVLARGLRDQAYIGTVAVIAAGLHVARIAAYGQVGITDAQVVLYGLILAICLPLGNLLGDRLRDRLTATAQDRVQAAVIVGALIGAGVGAFA